jgi:uncharacterized membrane protein
MKIDKADDANQVDTQVVMQSLGVGEPQRAATTRDLNEVVHLILIIGLYASVALMLAGVALDLYRSRALPVTVFSLSEALARTAQLRASGFFSLGLLLLILTPLLRVIGSVFVFAWERDWRFAGVTFLVMVVMIVSVLVGAG